MRSLRTVVVVALGGVAAVVAPAGAAVAAPAPAGHARSDLLPDPVTPVTGAVGASVAPVKNLTLDPLARTSVDPLDNAVGSQVADFKPLSTAAVTGPVSDGGSLGTLPVARTVTGLLPG